MKIKTETPNNRSHPYPHPLEQQAKLKGLVDKAAKIEEPVFYERSRGKPIRELTDLLEDIVNPPEKVLGIIIYLLHSINSIKEIKKMTRLLQMKSLLTLITSKKKSLISSIAEPKSKSIRPALIKRSTY